MDFLHTENRIKAIERVLDKRLARGASDSNLIEWLESLKNKSEWWNKHVIDGFIHAIKISPQTTSTYKRLMEQLGLGCHLIIVLRYET